MDEFTWSDGSKYERSKKEDNPENKTTDENKVITETVYDTTIKNSFLCLKIRIMNIKNKNMFLCYNGFVKISSSSR